MSAVTKKNYSDVSSADKVMLMLACYHLRFYELDQAIAVGTRANFCFFLDPYFSELDTLDFVPLGMLLIFHNNVGGPEKILTLDCTLRSIHHIELGEVRSIDTSGLDYDIETLNEVICVNAEESPGDVYGNASQPSGWLFTVELDVHAIIGISTPQIYE